MHKKSLSTSLGILILLVVTGCLDTTKPTIAPQFDRTNPAAFVSTAGELTSFTLVDYSQRSTSTAVTGANLLVSPTPLDVADPVVPNEAPGGTDGYVTFVVDQLLKGETIELPIYQQQNGADITIGQGDWAGKLKIITGYTPIANVIAFDTSVDGTGITFDNSAALPHYFPMGAWQIDAAAKIWEFPPPAIAVQPTGTTTWTPGSTVIIHLLADAVQGISGVAIPAATNAAGQEITLPAPNTNIRVAATVVVTFPAI